MLKNLTTSSGTYYPTSHTVSNSFATNGRRTGWGYDAMGNNTTDSDTTFTYDAIGLERKTGVRDLDNSGQFLHYNEKDYDGAGNLVKTNNYADSSGAGGTVNYYIRSSVLNKVVSETTETGAKRKTYISANGATLAEQVLTTYNSTTTESLNFYHQDPSATGTQTTNSAGNLNGNADTQRKGEYTPLGRNVADYAPYISLDSSEPNTDEGGESMFGSGQGFRPGQQTYAINGIRVSQSTFMLEIESGAIGGIFGLLEMSVRASARSRRVRDYSVRFNDGDMELERFFGSKSDAVTFAGRMNQNTVYKNILINDSWAIGNVLSAYQTGKPAPLTNEENKKLDGRVKILENKLKGKKCKQFLEDKLGKDGYKKILATLNNRALRFSGRRSTNITVEDAMLIDNPNARTDLLYVIKNAKSRLDRQKYKETLKELDWSVGKWFRRHSRVRAALGRINGKRVIFYQSFKKLTTILHENIHISTGLNDVKLAKALGLKDENGKDFKDFRKASPAISQALIDNKCSN